MKNLFLTFLCLFVCISLCVAQSITIDKMTCENRTNPVGIDVVNPTFSWVCKSTGRNVTQTAYELIVIRTDKNNTRVMCATGKVASDTSINIIYRGLALKSFTRYSWKVRVYDNKSSAGPWSKSAYFETAALKPSDWKANWIDDRRAQPANDADFYQDDAMPLFKKIVGIKSLIASARLYISGLGYYEAYLNGKKIGENVLDPGFTKYSKQVFYTTYDITSYLKQGQNVFGVMLGNGWWNPAPLRMFGRTVLRDFQQTGRPCLKAQLRIKYKNGKVETFATNSTWLTAPGPVRFNSVFLGEHDDARQEKKDFFTTEIAGWQAAKLVSGPSGNLEAQAQPPIHIIDVIKPVSIKHIAKDTFIVDMGENFAGVAQIRVNGHRGSTVKLRYGEALFPDGRLNYLTTVAGQIKEIWHINGGPGAPKTAWQEDSYTLKGGGVEQWHPRFTFHSFRYIQVTGWPGVPKLIDIDGLRMSADVEQQGSFACSNPMLNQLHEVTERTFLSNIFSVQSDCPAREKMGYGADIVVTADAFMFNFGMHDFYRKTISDFANDQQPDGSITEIAPFTGIASESPGGNAGPPGWQLVFPYLQYELYQFYGDIRPIQKYYPRFLKQMAFLESKAKDNLFEHDIADHAAIDEKPVAFDASLFYYHHALLAAKFARLVHHYDDEIHFNDLAKNIKSAIIAKYLHPANGGFANETQSAQLFALWYNIAPDTARSFSCLVDAIKKRDHHVSTGIFSTKMLFDVMRKFNRNDIAYQMANQRDFPGWGYMLAKGATTLWESWDYPDNANSQNHPMFGSVDEWFYRSLLGINPAAPGFKKIVIKPQPAGDLRSAAGTYHSVMGDIVSRWQLDGKTFDFHVEIPCNTTAEIWLPASPAAKVTEGNEDLQKVQGLTIRQEGSYRVITTGSGSYHFKSVGNE